MKSIATLNEYNELKSKLDAYNNATKDYCKANKTNCIPVEITKTFPFADEVDNDLRSAIETFFFLNFKPETYTIYINEEERIATTWTGQKLGKVYFYSEYRSSFGDTRISIRFIAENGMKYYGTYYKSNSSLASIKACKKQ